MGQKSLNIQYGLWLNCSLHVHRAYEIKVCSFVGLDLQVPKVNAKIGAWASGALWSPVEPKTGRESPHAEYYISDALCGQYYTEMKRNPK